MLGRCGGLPERTLRGAFHRGRREAVPVRRLRQLPLGDPASRRLRPALRQLECADGPAQPGDPHGLGPRRSRGLDGGWVRRGSPRPGHRRGLGLRRRPGQLDPRTAVAQGRGVRRPGETGPQPALLRWPRSGSRHQLRRTLGAGPGRPRRRLVGARTPSESALPPGRRRVAGPPARGGWPVPTRHQPRGPGSAPRLRSGPGYLVSGCCAPHAALALRARHDEGGRQADHRRRPQHPPGVDGDDRRHRVRPPCRPMEFTAFAARAAAGPQRAGDR